MSGRFGLILVALVVFGLAGCGGGSGKKELSLDQQLKKAQAEPDEAQRAKKMAAIGEKQVKAGDMLAGEATLNGAADVATKIEDAGKRAEALIAVAKAMGSAQKTSEAKKTLREAAKALEKVDDAQKRATALAELGSVAAVQLENPDAANEHLKNAELAAEKIDFPVARMQAYGKILIAYDMAKRPADETAITEKAKEYARSQETPRQQVDCLIEIADALAKAKKNDESAAIFADAKKTCESIKEDDQRGYAYLNVAKKLKAAGRAEEARKALSDADDAARKITDSSIRNDLVAEIQSAAK